MRRALVLTLLIAGIGAAAFSSPLSGSVDVCTTFNESGILAFDTVFDLDYTISGIVLGATARFLLNDFLALGVRGTQYLTPRTTAREFGGHST